MWEEVCINRLRYRNLEGRLHLDIPDFLEFFPSYKYHYQEVAENFLNRSKTGDVRHSAMTLVGIPFESCPDPPNVNEKELVTSSWSIHARHCCSLSAKGWRNSPEVSFRLMTMFRIHEPKSSRPKGHWRSESWIIMRGLFLQLIWNLGEKA